MNWSSENLDISGGKKSAPKQGRRAGISYTPDSTEQLLDSALEIIEDSSPRETVVRKTGGWADDGIKSTKLGGSANLIEKERFQDRAIHTNVIDDDDDIPIIPDIDEIQEELLSHREIKAPTIVVNTSTYRELDRELSTVQSSTADLQSLTKVNGIDLSWLTKKLVPEKDIKETDEEWTMDALFNDFIAANTNT